MQAIRRINPSVSRDDVNRHVAWMKSFGSTWVYYVASQQAQALMHAWAIILWVRTTFIFVWLLFSCNLQRIAVTCWSRTIHWSSEVRNWKLHARCASSQSKAIKALFAKWEACGVCATLSISLAYLYALPLAGFLSNIHTCLQSLSLSFSICSKSSILDLK